MLTVPDTVDMTTRKLPLSAVVLVVAMLTVVVGGCGQKGDLYLPDQPAVQFNG